MEENKEKSILNRNGLTTIKLIKENITVLDLSNKNISAIDDYIQLLVNLTKLNLAHNKLTEVPVAVLNLNNIKNLDVSFNEIQYFDDTPTFHETIEQLNISNNELLGPPYWIWAENCQNLSILNLSCNLDITNSFIDGYFEELLEYKTLVTNLTIYKCRIQNHLQIFCTFPKLRQLTAGISELSYMCHTNRIEELPCEGLNQCCDLEILNLSNTNIYVLNTKINMYNNLREIDLSLNKLSYLPDEFCCLVNLESCVLSSNSLLYLPDNFNKLEKLKSLFLNSNSLCMLPENLLKLPNLIKLDLYDNYIYEASLEIDKLQEVDLAQNYFNEPETEEYRMKREKMRLMNTERSDGRKVEVIRSESEYTKSETDDELDFKNYDQEEENRSISSPEDWDSDDYWIPHFSEHCPAPQSRWLHFVKQKMKDGNFCPMDIHPVSVAEQVKYEKLCYPKLEYESDGQFDDLSGDDS